MTLALLITAASGAWATDTYTVAGNNAAMFGSVWDPTYTANDMTKNGDGTYSITYTNVYLTEDVQYKVVKDHSWGEAYPDENRVINIAEAGTYTLTIHFNPTTHEVYETMPGSGSGEPDVEVTTNKAEGETTFTEATFNMPAYDATAEYELVRDMTESMTAQVGDGTAGVRYRVQKNAQTSTFQPVGLTNEQVRALFSVNDAIENTTLTQTTDYTVQIFAVNDEDQITGDAMTLANFTFAPGRYIVKAVAAEGSSYCGTTAESNIFVLFQGYEVTVAAGEYVTYYKDEALYTEDEDAKLYTITGVGETTATAARLEVVPALTPILVKNVGDTDQTFLLIPTTTQETVSFYNGFKGTLEATTIAASDDTKNNYAFNGQQFVWVKDAIAIGANKAWLEIPAAAAAARSLSIVFGDATGVRSIDNGQLTIDNWYDLNGRKLDGMPTKKGIYIMNGRKVVIR